MTSVRKYNRLFLLHFRTTFVDEGTEVNRCVINVPKLNLGCVQRRGKPTTDYNVSGMWRFDTMLKRRVYDGQ